MRGEFDPILVEARTALLDALDALASQRDSIVLIGAQAVYLRTGKLSTALAEMTKDADLAIDPRHLSDDPRLEIAMAKAGFFRPDKHNPGTWSSLSGVPVDLLVPKLLSGSGGRRAGRIPNHGKNATRKTEGIEACVIDRDLMHVGSLNPSDERNLTVHVAGPAALLVAKIYKISDRVNDTERLHDKDAHDCYRLLQSVQTNELAERFELLLNNEVSADVTRAAISRLETLFADSTDALGSKMAGRAEEGVGDPTQVALSTTLLSADLINELKTRGVR